MSTSSDQPEWVVATSLDVGSTTPINVRVEIFPFNTMASSNLGRYKIKW